MYYGSDKFMSKEITIELLQSRLSMLEDEKRIRECMNHYMHLCDMLTVGFPLDELLLLFTPDAVWEGKGSRYVDAFGRHQGREAIAEMFAKYTTPPAHFSLNIHVLGNELINVEGDTAHGSWLLVQPSSFSSGSSQLSCARINAIFKRSDERWLIDHFQTENLFTRRMQEPWDQSAPLPVPE